MRITLRPRKSTALLSKADKITDTAYNPQRFAMKYNYVVLCLIREQGSTGAGEGGGERRQNKYPTAVFENRQAWLAPLVQRHVCTFAHLEQRGVVSAPNRCQSVTVHGRCAMLSGEFCKNDEQFGGVKEKIPFAPQNINTRLSYHVCESNEIADALHTTHRKRDA